MKRFILLLVFISLGLCSNTLKASHFAGGEIRWVCIEGTGKYIFYMDIYRECTGTSFSFTTQSLRILNSTMPGISMKPDQATYTLYGGGNISPKGPSGCQKACVNGGPGSDLGATQFFPFVSDPVTLNGTPPSSGWVFYWEGFARPNSVENLVNSGSYGYGLRAIMYPFEGRNAGQCYDSSPEFEERPAILICKGYEFIFNHNASDTDLDSLVFRWAEPLDASASGSTFSPNPVIFKTGYSYDSPTPGPSINPKNQSATLNPRTGEIKLAVYSGQDGWQYATCIQVDAYRCGKKIASIFRDIPFIFFECPSLPGTGLYNNPPTARINGTPAANYSTEVFAGEKIQVPFQSTEFDIVYDDPNDPTTARAQFNALAPSGFMFSKDFKNPVDCEIPGIEPCATLTPAPKRNPRTGQLELIGQGGISTLFEWQTGCKHLSLNTGCTSNAGIYNFVMKTYDDHCDVPGVIYPSLSIKVKAPPLVPAPELRGASVELDGSVTVHLKKPPPPVETLRKYEVQYGLAFDATSAPTFSFLDSTDKLKGPYNSLTANLVPVNTSSPNPPLWEQYSDYSYLRMKSFSGCDGNQQSAWSDAVRVPRCKVAPAGPATAPNSKAKITWDLIRNPASKMLPTASKLYRIWANYPATTASIQDPDKWVLIGSTDKQEYIVQNALTCNELVAFRVEMRDSLRKDSLVSSFTSISSMVMEPENVAPTPMIDSVSVDVNGNVYIGITPGRPVSKHEVYDITNGTPGTLVLTLYGNNLDTLMTGQGADGKIKKYMVKAFDRCNAALTGTSTEHNTIYIDPVASGLVDTCNGLMKLSWNPYIGWPSKDNEVTYNIYVGTGGPTGSFNLLGSTTSTTYVHSGVLGKVAYTYKVMARDNFGRGSTSAIFNVQHPAKPSTEVVPAPLLLCSRVLDNGNVELDWESPRDSTGNRIGYEFMYRIPGGNWQPLPNHPSTPIDTGTTTATFELSGGFTANDGIIDIRVRTLSDSCGTRAPSPYSEILQTIYLEVDYQLTSTGGTNYNAGDISWNGLAIDSSSIYKVRRRFGDAGGNFSGNYLLLNATFDKELADAGSKYCDTMVQYRVDIEHPSAGCLNISSADEINYKDNADPNMQPIDYISYEHATGELVVKWSLKPQDSPDVDSVALVVPTADPSIFEEIARVPWSAMEIRTNHPSTDASVDVRTVALQAIDACDRDSKTFDFHSSIDVDASWDTCAKTVTLQWNPYETFRTGGAVQYSIFYSDDNISFQPLPTGVTNASSYTGSIPGLIESHSYYFYVTARDQGGSGIFFSNSNVDSIRTLVEGMPSFTYLRRATVNSPSEVQVDGFVDDAVAVGRYNIYRGLNTGSMARVGHVMPTEVVSRNFSFLDHTANTRTSSYYYSIEVQSPCGNLLDTSNLGRTIHLGVEADRERVANVLRFNAYEGWDTAVSHYNIYRGVDGVFDFLNVYATFVPGDGDGPHEFVDDLMEETRSLGSYCYVVEAIEGKVKEEFASFITSATSRSNYACADMEPLFYIPNAFSPGGMNKVFRPEGQFINYAYYEMIIYNRWGEKVFDTRDFFEGWDGTVNGEPAQDGTYVYTIRFRAADGKERSKKGTVTLIR